MKKLAAVALLAVGLGSTGCVTIATEDAIRRNVPDSGAQTIFDVATFPVTATVDVALLPAYAIATPFVIADLGHHNLTAH